MPPLPDLVAAGPIATAILLVFRLVNAALSSTPILNRSILVFKPFPSNKLRRVQGLKRSFNETRESLKEMCHRMKKFEIVHAQDFICLHLIRQVIEGCVSDLLLEYNNQKELKKEITAAQEDGAETLKQKLEVQLKYSEAKRQKLSVQLLKKIEEFEKLSVGRNYVKLIESQIGFIKLRIRGSTGPGVQDLIKVKEQLDEKLKLLYETLGINIQ